MFEQLSVAEERYQAINDRLMDPNVVSDPKQYAELMKEYKNLTPIVEKYREYVKARDDMEEARTMLDESGLDKDFRELIEEQYETSKRDIETISEELKILLIPKDPNDDKNVIVEIRGGAGGLEFVDVSPPDVAAELEAVGQTVVGDCVVLGGSGPEAPIGEHAHESGVNAVYYKYRRVVGGSLRVKAAGIICYVVFYYSVLAVLFEAASGGGRYNAAEQSCCDSL